MEQLRDASGKHSVNILNLKGICPTNIQRKKRSSLCVCAPLVNEDAVNDFNVNAQYNFNQAFYEMVIQWKVLVYLTTTLNKL